MNLQLLSLTLLSGLLLAACVHDLRRRRIPNALVLYGSALGLCLQALAPQALLPGGEGGPAAGLLGGLAGLALFLPLYLLRALGAGDVKLLAMAGVWLGAPGVLQAALYTLLAGGVLALAAALAGGTLRPVLRNVARLLGGAVLRAGSAGLLAPPPVQPTGRLPYALAIAAGTSIELFLRLQSS